jgi:NADH dehydrogenase [ubiquinone] 1 alpha subcomplex assembly factor 7
MSEPLIRILQNHITQSGPLDIGKFTEIVLSHPEHGYYMRRDPFGEKGDFTTAPEISQMFGEMIGAWAADTWIKLGSPPELILAECGPGRGTLMADALRATKKVSGFHEAVQIHLIETSPVLREKQKEMLTGYKVQWHETVHDLPREPQMILMANEFLDALPVRQLVKTAGGWREKVVAFEDGKFVFVLRESAPELPEEVPEHINSEADEGDIYEISPVRRGYAEGIFKRLGRQGGAVLFIDYGHERASCGDTLQAVHRHEFCDVLDNIGEADITAHVNFEELKKAAEVQGMYLEGPVTQSDFLKNLGIDLRAEMLCRNADSHRQDQIRSELERLISAGQMGNLFKVLAVSSQKEIELAGF